MANGYYFNFILKVQIINDPVLLDDKFTKMREAHFGYASS